MGEDDRRVEARPVTVTVKVHRSSSRDGGLGWEVYTTAESSPADVDAAVERALRGHRKLEAALLGPEAFE